MPLFDRIESRASQDRLERLIEARLEPGADTQAIDERIWKLFGERWAVMFTDLIGFSRNVAEFGIIHFLQTIYESHRLLVPIIERENGILLKTEGDSLIIMFRNVNDALRAGLAMQARTLEHNQARIDTEKVLLCMGIGCGEVLRIGDADIFGAEVNAASKLGEDVAQAGDILLTGAAVRALRLPPNVTVTPIENVPAGADSAYRVVVG